MFFCFTQELVQTAENSETTSIHFPICIALKQGPGVYEVILAACVCFLILILAWRRQQYTLFSPLTHRKLRGAWFWYGHLLPCRLCTHTPPLMLLFFLLFFSADSWGSSCRSIRASNIPLFPRLRHSTVCTGHQHYSVATSRMQHCSTYSVLAACERPRSLWYCVFPTSKHHFVIENGKKLNLKHLCTYCIARYIGDWEGKDTMTKPFNISKGWYDPRSLETTGSDKFKCGYSWSWNNQMLHLMNDYGDSHLCSSTTIRQNILYTWSTKI